METFGQCCNYFLKKHVLISTRFQILRYQCQKLQSSTTCPQIPAPETRWLINKLKRMMTLILFIGPCQAGLPALKKLTWGNCQLENISVYQQINHTSTTVNYACSYVEHIDNDSPLPTVWRNLESPCFPQCSDCHLDPVATLLLPFVAVSRTSVLCTGQTKRAVLAPLV